jgi:acetolactate decarboxylase
VLDERLIHSLHVTAGDHSSLPNGVKPHEVFQTSTFAALLDGRFEGDVSFAELAEHGNLGLGTFDGVDGEMVAVDGAFWRCDVGGVAHPVEPERRTPFACLVAFEATHTFSLDDPVDWDGLMAALDRRLGAADRVHAVRIDGHFDAVHARSVAGVSKPYPPMTEIVKAQNVFDFEDVEGTMVGFRFPDFASGINVPGYHLHFITADRERGGHVLGARTSGVTVAVDDETEIRVELPRGVDVDAAASDEAIDAIERKG